MSTPRDQVLEQGYTLLECVYSLRECDEIREIFRRCWERAGSPSTGGSFGFVMHPILKFAPELARFYNRAEVIDALRNVFQDEPRLAHSGGLMSDSSRKFTEWHYHRSDSVEASAWNPHRAERPATIERVLGNIYVDGSSDEMGPLLLYPRRIDDVLAPPHQERFGDWEGQRVIHCAPGSMIIFDQNVWHAARPAKCAKRRHLFGGHYQGWNNPIPHREDNSYGGEELRHYKEQYPLFRALLERSACAV